MSDRHKYTPIRLRRPEADRLRLLSYAEQVARPVTAVLAEYLDRRGVPEKEAP